MSLNFLHLGAVYYGHGFISNGFLILDIEYYNNDSLFFWLHLIMLLIIQLYGMLGLAI